MNVPLRALRRRQARTAGLPASIANVRPMLRTSAADAVRHFLRFYGPADTTAFTDWAGVAKPHAKRLWKQVEDELAKMKAELGPGSGADAPALDQGEKEETQ